MEEPHVAVNVALILFGLWVIFVICLAMIVSGGNKKRLDEEDKALAEEEKKYTPTRLW